MRLCSAIRVASFFMGTLALAKAKMHRGPTLGWRRTIGMRSIGASLVAIVLLCIGVPSATKADGIGISEPALSLINTRVSQTQTQFCVYLDIDASCNHGFPSGVF